MNKIELVFNKKYQNCCNDITTSHSHTGQTKASKLETYIIHVHKMQLQNVPYRNVKFLILTVQEIKK